MKTSAPLKIHFALFLLKLMFVIVPKLIWSGKMENLGKFTTIQLEYASMFVLMQNYLQL